MNSNDLASGWRPLVAHELRALRFYDQVFAQNKRGRSFRPDPFLVAAMLFHAASATSAVTSIG